MTGAILGMTSFTLSKFHKTDLSGAKLGYADISLTDITDVTIIEDSNIKVVPAQFIRNNDSLDYDKEKYKEMLLDASEICLGNFWIR